MPAPAPVFMERFDLADLVRRAVERARHSRLPDADAVAAPAQRRSDGRRFRLPSARSASPPRSMDADDARGACARRISPNVVQMYGATETGAGGDLHLGRGNGRRAARQRRPADAQRRPSRRRPRAAAPLTRCRAGRPGEILLTSPSLAAGIWDDPTLTARSFIIDGDRRWWRSGDLGRLDARRLPLHRRAPRRHDHLGRHQRHAGAGRGGSARAPRRARVCRGRHARCRVGRAGGGVRRSRRSGSRRRSARPSCPGERPLGLPAPARL